MFRFVAYRFAFLTFIITTPVIAQENNDYGEQFVREVMSLAWQRGPAVGYIPPQATIQVPTGYQFLGPSGTRRFLELNGNLPRDNNYTFGPADFNWFTIFSFDPSGYVRDDEAIDPDALLQSLKEQNRRGNEERRKRGIEQLLLEGWFIEPHYDLKTNRLEWGTRLRGENGEITVNYNIRLLGRSGVMSALLVSEPNRLTADLTEFKNLLAGYDFLSGQRYSEFRTGDKVAKYGITALIVGGAAAAAAKSGAGKALFKFLGIAVIGVVAAGWAFLKRSFGRRPTSNA